MDTKLTVVLGDYPHTRALNEGRVQVPGYQLDPVSVTPIISAYRRMIRDLEFDVCELAPVSYLMARQAGVALTAIPVFLNRRFHHGDLQCAARSGIKVPRDLEGRRVGARAYTVTTAVWARGILQEEYGVDPQTVTWVVDDEDHVEGRTPANVERAPEGVSLGQLLREGRIDAALTGNAGTGRAGAPRADWAASALADKASEQADGQPYPLFAEAEALSTDWFTRTGIYPVHSLIVLRSELAERDPDLAAKFYTAFAESKREYLVGDPRWDAQPRFARQARQVHGDPVPYGTEANDPSVRALARYAHDQGLADPGEFDGPRSLFAQGDYPTA
ncbi:MAG TPA: ABC transporter substrate-binding protein [Actinocrinis sp.]|jgi:4,5-dihydroxyphthalate decarboxylase